MQNSSYDPNFLQFLLIFGDKVDVFFLKTNVMMKLAVIEQKRHFFAKKIVESILKIIKSVAGSYINFKIGILQVSTQLASSEFETNFRPVRVLHLV
jgi:hypothetical protein